MTALVMTGLLAGCGSESASVPNVLGYRLDDAHAMLKDVGFEQFDDVDAIEDRTPFLDSNWVVLGQSPKAGESAEIDSTVRLEIAKPDDDGVRSRIPAGSPVAEELHAEDERNSQRQREQATADAQRQRDQAVADAKEVREFIDDIDPSLRVVQNVVAKLMVVSGDIASNGAVLAQDVLSLGNIRDLLDRVWAQFENAPQVVNDDADMAQEALRDFQNAARTLLSAEDAAASGSLDRFGQLYRSAQSRYNDSVAVIYRETGVQPPTV